MLLRDIIIIIILLLLLVVLKIINNKFIEDFVVTSIGTNTNNRAITQNDNVNSNNNNLNNLQDTTGDLEQQVNANRNLSNSTQYNDNNVLEGGLSLKEIDELFNDAHGKFIKKKNKKCNYLDITEYIPCEDTDPIPNKGPSKCQINCAKNCDDDDNCISFEYNRSNKSCSLSSSCYDTTENGSNLVNNYYKDVYFKRGASIPAFAQFNKRENKKCNDNTKIENGTFNNQTLTECAQKCLDNSDCISFEFKEIDGNNSNVCNITNDCHQFNYTNDNNSDVYMKNNVIINDTITNRQLSCPTDNKNKLPFVKRIIFYQKKDGKGNKWTKDFKSHRNTNVSWVGKNQNDDYDSVRIPGKTRLILYRDTRFRKRFYEHSNNYSGPVLKNLGKKNHNRASSYRLINL